MCLSEFNGLAEAFPSQWLVFLIGDFHIVAYCCQAVMQTTLGLSISLYIFLIYFFHVVPQNTEEIGRAHV